jgi:hypothetical protein
MSGCAKVRAASGCQAEGGRDLPDGLACRAALVSDAFNRDVQIHGRVNQKRRTKQARPAATREQVYRFAWGAIEAGHPEPAAAAVICFEFLQRPENVLAGYLVWPDYRGREVRTAIKIVHHKTGAVIWHPLEEPVDGGVVQFYADAEAVLARLPRRGVPMILKAKRDGTAEPRADGVDRPPPGGPVGPTRNLYARRRQAWRHYRAGGGGTHRRAG